MTVEKTKNYKYETAAGEVIYRAGVVAMSITVTKEGLIFHDCNIFHMVNASQNSITAVDYMTYNNGLDDLFRQGMDGIMAHMRKNMSHLIRRSDAARITEVEQTGEESWNKLSMQYDMSQAERDALRTGAMPSTFGIRTNC